MLIWIIFALLIIVPLALQLRGATIVGLAASAALLYPIGVLLAAWSFGISPTGAELNPATPAPGDPAALSDGYMVVTNFGALVWLVAVFALIAGVFATLSRWGATLPHDRLKNLFWLLHISLLALPFAMYIFVSFGIFDTYLGGDSNLPVFAMSSMVTSILCLIALAGFAFTALVAALKRLRG